MKLADAEQKGGMRSVSWVCGDFFRDITTIINYAVRFLAGIQIFCCLFKCEFRYECKIVGPVNSLLDKCQIFFPDGRAIFFFIQKIEIMDSIHIFCLSAIRSVPGERGSHMPNVEATCQGMKIFMKAVLSDIF